MTIKNLKYTVAYLKPKQLNRLKELKESIEKEHGISFSVSEFIRDAVDDFLLTTEDEEGMKDYLELKGW